jgi:hypothetical protein
MFCELHAMAAKFVFRTFYGPDLRSQRGSHVGSLYRPRMRRNHLVGIVVLHSRAYLYTFTLTDIVDMQRILLLVNIDI